MKQLLQFSLISIILLTSISSASAIHLQVGAYGDEASVGNVGVKVEIQTSTYHVAAPDADFFWVGDYLRNGAFIQFGYELLYSGKYCISGSTNSSPACSGNLETINDSEPVWFWEYFPNSSSNQFYWRNGATALPGPNGTWHTYTIMPNPFGYWIFLIDNVKVSSTSFLSTNSSLPAMFAAEKGTQTGVSGLATLGPVQFRNLAYLGQNGWHLVTALFAISDCGMQKCETTGYGISLVGPNYVVAGSSLPPHKGGELLWSTSATAITTSMQNSRVLMPEALYIGLGGIFALLIIGLKRHVRKHAKT